MTERLLLLDSVSDTLRLSLTDGEGRVVFDRAERYDSQRYHSAILFPLLQEGLSAAGYPLRALTGVGVNTGPGSFTGIRTSLSVVQTLAQWLPIPVYVFNHFELLADATEPTQVVLNALRGNVYTATLAHTPQGPHYTQLPAWIPLAELALSLRPVASSSLDLPQAHPAEAIHTPQAMARLIAQASGYYQQQPLAPLYLQPPNITLKKSLLQFLPKQTTP